jgi:hypothetical protein
MSTLTLGLTDRRNIELPRNREPVRNAPAKALGLTIPPSVPGSDSSAYGRTSAQPDFWRSVMTSRRLRSTWRRSAVTG